MKVYVVFCLSLHPCVSLRVCLCVCWLCQPGGELPPSWSSGARRQFSPVTALTLMRPSGVLVPSPLCPQLWSIPKHLLQNWQSHSTQESETECSRSCFLCRNPSGVSECKYSPSNPHLLCYWWIWITGEGVFVLVHCHVSGSRCPSSCPFSDPCVHMHA